MADTDELRVIAEMLGGVAHEGKVYKLLYPRSGCLGCAFFNLKEHAGIGWCSVAELRSAGHALVRCSEFAARGLGQQGFGASGIWQEASLG